MAVRLKSRINKKPKLHTLQNWLSNDQVIAQVASLPALLVVASLVLIPIGIVFWSSIRDVSFRHIFGENFVGFVYYQNLFSNPYFWQAAWTTVFFIIGTVLPIYVVGLVSAVLLSRRFFGKRFVFPALLLPWAMPVVPSAMIWRWMLHGTYGILNWLLIDLGVISKSLQWFTEPQLARVAVMLATMWRRYPLAFLMLYAALQMIPNRLYEAARIDGANAWQKFWHITLPGIRFVSFVLLMLQILFSVRAVTTIFVMTGGGPQRATETLSLFTYIEAFRFYNLTNAAASGILTLVLIITITTIYRMIMKEVIK